MGPVVRSRIKKEIEYQMYKAIIRPLLFALNIEHAHRLVVELLRLMGHIPGGRWLLKRLYAEEHPSLEREVFGLKFRNPVGLAAGFDRNGDIFRELSAMGFGFIEIGTVTPRAQSGNQKPRIFRLAKDRAIINRIGLSNKGLERAISNLRHPHEGIIVGCNIGKNTITPPEVASSDYLKVFRNLYQYADYFVVNISYNTTVSPFTPTTRKEVMAILEPLFDFRRGQNQYRPILMKISPDMSDETVDLMTDIMVETPLDGIVATNATSSREGLVSSPKEIASCGEGAMSGKPLTERSIEIVRRISARCNGTYPIIGVGGMMSADDVRRMLDAGASLVQLYTGFIYGGPRIIRDICRSLITPDAEQPAQAEESPAQQDVVPEQPDEPKIIDEPTSDNEPIKPQE